MSPSTFQRVFPIIKAWMDQTVTDHAVRAKSVVSLGFARLPQFFSGELLAAARVVLVDRCPMPPLSRLGLTEFAEFERMNPDGITYLDTYFLVARHVATESLHFHELVHVVQWRVLGAERFLSIYSEGLERHGYRHSPLEVMAYDHEALFKAGVEPYSVEAEVQASLQTFC